VSSHRVGDDLSVAKAMSAWKDEVRARWPKVRVVNVDTSGIGSEPSMGNVLSVRAFVDLGGLTPQDVEVQTVTGRVDGDEELHEITVVPMTAVSGPTTAATGPASGDAGAGDLEGHRYEAQLTLDSAGLVGYTVRVVPRHPLLATPAELGLVVHA
jgi:starch phosphorylase